MSQHRIGRPNAVFYASNWFSVISLGSSGSSRVIANMVLTVLSIKQQQFGLASRLKYLAVRSCKVELLQRCKAAFV